MTDITLTPAQFATLLDLLGTADTGEQEYNLTMNLTAKLLLLRMNGGGAPAPVASFTALNDYATNVLKVNFTDTSTGTPTSWAWNFGDGNTSTSQNPTHTYAAAGTYTVTLTSTNATGSSAPVAVDVPVNAFHAAVLAAGSWPRFLDFRTASGMAINDGTDGAGGDGTVFGSTRGLADVTGNPDAFLFTSGTDKVDYPNFDFSGNFTIGVLFKQGAATQGLPFFGLQGAGSSQIRMDTGFNGETSFGITVQSGATQTILTTDVGFLTTGQTYLVFLRFNSTSGVTELRYSDDGTIKTLPLVYDDSPMSPASAVGVLDDISSSGVAGDFTQGAVFWISSFLNDAALLPIAAAVFP